MGVNYSDIGLGDNLLKLTSSTIDKIDPDLQIDDGSIQGIKLMTKSVSLQKLYGQDLEVGGNSNISGRIVALDSNGNEKVSIDASNGIQVTNNSGLNTFTASIASATPGYVTVGDYSGGQGLQYDNTNLTIKGTLTASVINGGTISGTTITGGTISATNLSGSTISGNTISGGSISGASISGNTITGGTISGTTISGSTVILDQSTDAGGSTNAFLRWSGGSKIWSDTTNNMGINSIGSGGMYIYTNNSQRIFIGSSNINLYPATTFIKKINFGFDGQNEGNIENADVIKGYNDLRFQCSGDDFKFLNDAGSGNVVRIDHISGQIHSTSSTIDLATNTLQLTGGSGFKVNGTSKSAIVPTSKGYRALYTNESPDVWFMDFCPGKRVFKHEGWKFWEWGFEWVAQPDLLFMEVTNHPYVIIPTGNKGIVQVWGKRKGFENVRFEEKTKEEFEKNNKFWGQAKV